MAFFALMGFAGCALAQQGAVPVAVVTLEPRAVTLTATLPGRVRALAESEVRPQVGGVVIERLFTEGAHVAAGDILYRLDATSYVAAVDQARAALRQAEAQLRAADRTFERVQELSARGASSQQVLDDATAARDIAQAQLGAAEAALRAAQIELDRTEVRALLSGRIGLSEITEGALVTASQAGPLTVVRRLDHVYVDVTQSAADLIAWRRGLGDAAPSPEIRLLLADGAPYLQTGLLTAAEPRVDEQTGVVVLRIEFPNPDELLLPGMYVQVEMPTRQIGGVFLVPQQAVGRDRRGDPFVWRVSAENTVEQQPVVIQDDLGGDWIVSGGLAPGDRIAVSNLQRLSSGAAVAPRDADASEG